MILGAGASWDYGFPTGKELVKEICRPLCASYPRYPDPRSSTITADDLKQCGIDTKHYVNFQGELLKSRLSVDAFIENRPKYDEIGRKAIAIVLLRCEDEKRLFWGTEDYLYFEQLRKSNGGGIWYDLILDHIAKPFSFDDFGKNALSFVTFNYDRSLEHFLFSSLRSSSDRNDNECKQKVSEIPIIHVYGSLGPLLWQEDSGIPYDRRKNREYVSKSAQHIHLIRAGGEETISAEFQQAHDLLEDAERIFLLGFGFDYTNIRRLKLKELAKGKEVWATCLGLSQSVKHIIEHRQRRVKTGIADICDIINSNKMVDSTVYEFLHDKAILD